MRRREERVATQTKSRPFLFPPLNKRHPARLRKEFEALVAKSELEWWNGRLERWRTAYDDVRPPITAGGRTFVLRRPKGQSRQELVVRDADGRETVLDTFTAANPQRSQPGHEGLAVSADGTKIAFAFKTGINGFAETKIAVFELKEEDGVFHRHENSLAYAKTTSLSFSPDGKYLAHTRLESLDGRRFACVYDVANKRDTELVAPVGSDESLTADEREIREWATQREWLVTGPDGTFIRSQRMATTCGPNAIAFVDPAEGKVYEVQPRLTAFTKLVAGPKGTGYGVRFQGDPGRGELVHFDLAAAREGRPADVVVIPADDTFVMQDAEILPREGKAPLIAVFERKHGGMSRIRIHDMQKVHDREPDAITTVHLRNVGPEQARRLGPKIEGSPEHSVFGRIDEMRFATGPDGSIRLYWKHSSPLTPPQLWSVDIDAPDAGPDHEAGTDPLELGLPDVHIEPYVLTDENGRQHRGYRLVGTNPRVKQTGNVVVSAYAASFQSIIQGFQPTLSAMLERGDQVVLALLPGDDSEGHQHRLDGIGMNRERQAEALNAHGRHVRNSGWSRGGTVTMWVSSWAATTGTLALRKAPRGVWDVVIIERGVSDAMGTRPDDWDVLDTALPTPAQIDKQLALSPGRQVEPRTNADVIVTQALGDLVVRRTPAEIPAVYLMRARHCYVNQVDGEEHTPKDHTLHARQFAAWARLTARRSQEATRRGHERGVGRRPAAAAQADLDLHRGGQGETRAGRRAASRDTDRHPRDGLRLGPDRRRG